MTFLAFHPLRVDPAAALRRRRFRPPLWTSTLMTGVTFFSIGSLRSHWSPPPWWRAGLETFVIGIIGGHRRLSRRRASRRTGHRARASRYTRQSDCATVRRHGHQGTKLHARHRGGISPRRQGHARPGAGAAACAARQMRGGAARPGQPRIPALADRGRHLRLQIHAGGARPADPSAQHGRPHRRRVRPRPDRRLDPSLRQMVRASSTPTRSATTCSPTTSSRWRGGS